MRPFLACLRWSAVVWGYIKRHFEDVCGISKVVCGGLRCSGRPLILYEFYLFSFVILK